MLVSQSLKTFHRRNTSALFLKLDIARAFDSLSWPFLLEVLRRRGFGPKFCSWVVLMLATANTRILVNGFPGEQIFHARGLRQGDPASPQFFILIMDVLTAVFSKSEEAGLFEPLCRWGIRHRLSIYADDVAMFIRPCEEELTAANALLRCFGDASGLVTNMAKSAIMPIKCSEESITEILPAFPCQLAQFPCKYLGLPLSPKNLRKIDWQPLLDELARRLSTWRTALLTEGGRLVLVASVLMMISIYHMLSLDLPPWVLQTINKICRRFFWKGSDDARGGHCRVAWDQVCRPKLQGGLGLHNLQLLNDALRIRWYWMEKVGPLRAWNGLDFKLSANAEAMFVAATECTIGDGRLTIFWRDRWINGKSAKEIAPDLIPFVAPQKALRMTVNHALDNDNWIKNIKGTLSVQAIVQFVNLWQAIQAAPALSEEPDQFRWLLTANGMYSARSAYQGFCLGMVDAGYAELIWGSGAPLKEKLFMWLAVRNRCWTGARLNAKGLQGPPRCLYCDQLPETIDHLMVQCPHVRTIWFRILSDLGLGQYTPQQDSHLTSWWCQLSQCQPKLRRKTLTTTAIACCRILWLERNSRHFEGKFETEERICNRIRDELRTWHLATRSAEGREE